MISLLSTCLSTDFEQREEQYRFPRDFNWSEYNPIPEISHDLVGHRDVSQFALKKKVNLIHSRDSKRDDIHKFLDENEARARDKKLQQGHQMMFAPRFRGEKQDPHKDQFVSLAHAARDNLPSTVDWSGLLDPSVTGFPHPDQFTLGSCSANMGQGAILLDQQIKKRNGKYDLPLVLISRLANYYYGREEMKSTRDDTGATIGGAVKAAELSGFPEDKWPYEHYDTYVQVYNSALVNFEGKWFHAPAYVKRFAVQPPGELSAWSKDNIFDDLNITFEELPFELGVIKTHIDDGKGICFGTAFCTTLSNSRAEETGIIDVPSPEDMRPGGHAMLIVGYDDDREAFKVRNSWSDGWGLKGYCWMQYEHVLNSELTGELWDFRNILKDGNVIIDSNPPTAQYPSVVQTQGPNGIFSSAQVFQPISATEMFRQNPQAFNPFRSAYHRITQPLSHYQAAFRAPGRAFSGYQPSYQMKPSTSYQTASQYLFQHPTQPLSPYAAQQPVQLYNPRDNSSAFRIIAPQAAAQVTESSIPLLRRATMTALTQRQRDQMAAQISRSQRDLRGPANATVPYPDYPVERGVADSTSYPTAARRSGSIQPQISRENIARAPRSSQVRGHTEAPKTTKQSAGTSYYRTKHK